MRKMSAFDIWLRRGRIVAEPEPIETKFNPWHDPKDGRFTFARQGKYFSGGGRAGGGGGGWCTRCGQVADRWAHVAGAS